MSKINQERCPVEISGHFVGEFHTCNRPFNTEEQRQAGLCGIHLRAKTKREASERAWKASRTKSDKNRESAEAFAEKLAALGIDAVPHYRHSGGRGMGGYSGLVIVDADNVLQAIKNHVREIIAKRAIRQADAQLAALEEETP